MFRGKVSMSILLSIFGGLFSFYTTSAIPCDFSQFDKNTIQYGLEKLEVPIACNLYPSKQDESKYIDEDNNYIRKKYDRKLSPREVFLTFDDGPSPVNTRKILEILKKYDVKATFFVIGKYAEQHPDIVKKLKQEGMCIAPHTYSHDYKIYRSEDAYFDDYEACSKVIMKLTGRETIPYLRLPGGSAVQVSNKDMLKKIKTKLNNNNIKYVDWNVSSADAAMETVPTSLIKNNVISQCRGKKFVVILMHDSNTKTTTVEALPEVIEYLKSNGYAFKTFDDVTISEERQMNRLQIINRY
jgi:peptidoglycan/xylan/chitin deacetylase (PgdA/CDA1 family)